MSKTTHHSKLPLAPLFLRLELAGFTISPADRLRAWRVLSGPGKAQLREPVQLKYILAPILARSEAEQQTFYDIFDQYWTELQQPLPTVDPVQRTWPWWGKWVLLALLVLGGVYGFYRMTQQEVVTHDPIAIYLNGPQSGTEGDSVRFSNASAWPADSSRLTWRWQYETFPDGEVILADSIQQEFVFAVPPLDDSTGNLRSIRLRIDDPVLDTFYEKQFSFIVFCPVRPSVEAINVNKKDIQAGETVQFRVRIPEEDLGLDNSQGIPRLLGIAQNWLFEWDFGDGSPLDTGTYFASHSYAQNGQYTVGLNVTDTTELGACTVPLRYELKIGTDEVILPSLPLRKDRLATLALWGWGYYLLLAALGVGVVFHWVRWFTRRQQPAKDPEEAKNDALAARFAHSDKAPYYLPLQDQSYQIPYSGVLEQLADAMRIRQRGLRRVIDVPNTLQTTIDRGGYPSLQFRFASQPSEFLVLLDEQNRASHLGELYKYLVDRLRAQDVNIELYYYRKYPNRFWNHYFPQGRTLGQLRRAYPGHRVVLFGDAHELIDPHAKENLALRPLATRLFRQWRQCYLLTPVPPVSWSYREQLLAGLFHVFPVDETGLRAWANHLQRTTETPPSAHQFLLKSQAQVQERQDTTTEHRSWRRWKNTQEYLSHYGADLERWFKALAVFPLPTWELTIAIGQAIGVTITYDKLLYLARIPALQAERFPEKLRQQLLDELDPEEERLARQAVQKELQAVQLICADSHVSGDLERALAIQEFALEPEQEQHKDAIRYLLQNNLLSPGQEAELDHVVTQSVNEPAKKYHAKRSSARNWLSNTATNLQKETRAERQDRINDLRLAVLLTIGYLALLLFGWQLGGTDTLYRLTFNEMPSERALLSEEPLRDRFLVKEAAVVDSAIIYNNQGVDQVLGTEDIDTLAAHYFASAIATANPLIHGKGDRFEGEVVNYALANANWSKLYFNAATARQRAYLQDSVGEGMLNVALDLLERAYRSDSTALDVLHAKGVVHYYNGNPERSQQLYDQLDSLDYFSTNYLRPNLADLLNRTRSEIISVETVPQARQNLEVNVAYYQNTSTDSELELVLTPEGRGRQPEAQRQKIDADPRTQRFVFEALEKGGSLNLLRVELFNSSTGKLVDSREETVRHSWLRQAPPPVPESSDAANAATDEPINIREQGDEMLSGNFSRTYLPFEVLEAKTLLPIAGAKVVASYVGTGGARAEDERTTDAKGLFELYIQAAYLQQEQFRVEVTREGYSPLSTTLTLAEVRAQVQDGAFKLYLDRAVTLPQLRRISTKRFLMGTPTDGGKQSKDDLSKPAHDVTLDNFSIGVYEVTFAQYDQFCEATQREKPQDYHLGGRGQYPVTSVSWYDAVSYCNWLSEQTNLPFFYNLERTYDKRGYRYTVTIPNPQGKGYRLPTEAEWEYAARSAPPLLSDFRYAGSDNLDQVGWYAQNSGDRTHPVGQKAPNQIDVYDMSGNVWEWTEDNVYDYPSEGQVNPRHNFGGTQRMIRGGAYLQQAYDCTVRVRQYLGASEGQIYVGFRVARYE
ncbi:MAG: SUMF1/EgtB/PvdO family nonheme iron enzyme [Bacteroidota bacterium]